MQSARPAREMGAPFRFNAAGSRAQGRPLGRVWLNSASSKRAKTFLAWLGARKRGFGQCPLAAGGVRSSVAGDQRPGAWTECASAHTAYDWPCSSATETVHCRCCGRITNPGGNATLGTLAGKVSRSRAARAADCEPGTKVANSRPHPRRHAPAGFDDRAPGTPEPSTDGRRSKRRNIAPDLSSTPRA